MDFSLSLSLSLSLTHTHTHSPQHGDITVVSTVLQHVREEVPQF